MRHAAPIIIGGFDKSIFRRYFSIESANDLHHSTERLPTPRIRSMKSGDKSTAFLRRRLNTIGVRDNIRRPNMKYKIPFPAFRKLKVTLTLCVPAGPAIPDKAKSVRSTACG